MADSRPDDVPSPCIKVCTLDAAGVCQGCHRTIEEIMAWTRLDAAGKQSVLAASRARARRVASG